MQAPTWSNQVDIDADLYTRSRTINFTATSNQNISVVLRIYSYLDGGSPSSYWQSNSFALLNGTVGYYQDGIGTSTTTGELPHGQYDFIVQLRRADNTSVILAERNSSDASLNNEYFETTAEDQIPTITMQAPTWSNQVDIDAD